MIFVGTVIEILNTRKLAQSNTDWVTRALVRVDKNYKGTPESTLILFDDGMCDGPVLKLGEQFLWYTGRYSADSDVPSRGCTRSRPIRFAAEDIQYLDGLTSTDPKSSVFGRVELWSNQEEDRQGAAAAEVELRGSGDVRRTIADNDGRYTFDGLPPGTYTVTATLPGFHLASFQEDGPAVKPEARGCAVANIFLQKDWPGKVSGRLIRPDGTPAPAGIDVQLLRLERHGQEESYIPVDGFITTDEHGEYAFRFVAPGRYKLAVHPCCSPTPEVPYAAMYWPAAATEETSAVITIRDLATTKQYDFHLPPELPSQVIAGVVLQSDGQPAAQSRVEVLMLDDDGPGSSYPLTADKEGRFSFTVFKGLKYSLKAFSALDRRLQSASMPCSFDQTQPVRLILNAPESR